MAIYHFTTSNIGRAQGRSAVACAAYRAGERLYDERQDCTHDYSRKQDVAYSEILVPKNAPDWMRDRESLWNSVEQSEKRKDARVAREIQFALPRELTLEQNIALAKEFVQQEFVDKGMVADLAIHVDKGVDGEWQPHAHVLLTTREVTVAGFGQKVREWNQTEHLQQWREAWAETANRHLSLHGHDLQIDHRTLAAQGIELEPQHKIGATVARERLARLADHERIARENGEKILADPNIALTGLTRQQSTFTYQDLARFVNRHTVDAEQFQAVYEKVKACEQVIYLGKDANSRDRYTTQEMLTLERQMSADARSLQERTTAHGIPREALKTLSKPLAERQMTALQHIAEAGDLKCLVGYAGTGKSYLLDAAREVWEVQGYQVQGAALSGIAAENLEKSSGISSRTLASYAYRWDRGEDLLSKRDVLVVDEAGMIGSRQMARLLSEAERAGAKVVLIGDPWQLQAIEAGAAFRAISEQSGYVELTEIRRQREDWQKEATLALAQQRTAEGLQAYAERSHVHEFETQAVAKKALVEQWFADHQQTPEKSQLMLSYTRKDVQELNEMARELLRGQGQLGQDHAITTQRGERQFAEGERIYFLENNRQLGVMNGTLGTIEKINGQQLQVRLDVDERQASSKVIQVDTTRYNALDHGYAGTIHKSQGVTVDKAYVLASRYMDGHASYVGMSRHRESADLYWSREEFAQQRDMLRTLSRDRSKDVTLDYPQTCEAFAEQRGIQVSDALVKQMQQARETAAMAREQTRPADSLREFSFSAEEIDRYSKENFQRTSARQEFDELKAFAAQFEKEHPQLSKTLSREIQPTRKEQAAAIEDRLMQLNQQIKRDPLDRAAKREFTQLAVKVAKDEQLMQHIRDHAPALDKQIKFISQMYEQHLDRDRGRGGISR